MKNSVLRAFPGMFLPVVLILGLSALGFRPANTTLALITKVIKDVTHKAEDTDWGRAAKGNPLRAGDHLRTGVQSLAIVKFNDRSIVRVREKSEIAMSADPDGQGVIKTVQLSKGAYGFDIRKQVNDKFGKWSGGEGFDTLVVNEGLVNLANEVSRADIDVPAGYIAFSNQDGSLTSRQATPEELAEALAMATGGTPRELELKLRNGQGEEKDLKIKFKQ
jgi:hypothetical protein